MILIVGAAKATHEFPVVTPEGAKEPFFRCWLLSQNGLRKMKKREENSKAKKAQGFSGPLPPYSTDGAGREPTLKERIRSRAPSCGLKPKEQEPSALGTESGGGQSEEILRRVASASSPLPQWGQGGMLVLDAKRRRR